MGGGGSKTPVETEEKRASEVHRINGVRVGDVITIRGEPFAGVDKFFAINFYHNDDIAFLFKAVLLGAEGVYNKIKMNYRTNGTWGPEVRMENVIYLNHHFELRFTCMRDKFSVAIDGAHFADFPHHISPDKINAFDLAGDANWKPVEMPNSVKAAAEYGGPLLLPSADDVNAFIESLRTDGPILASAVTAKEGEQLQQLIIEGLEVTKKLMGDPEPNLWGEIAKIGGYLKSVYSAGSAVFAFIKFINGIGKDTDVTIFKKKLDEISLQLARIDKSIQQGFAKLIEHMDFVQFRGDVQNNVIALFDLYTRCYTVNGTIPVAEFKKLCSEARNSPRHVFSTMFGFLTSDNNIIESHLKTQKHVYSIYQGWSNVFFNNAIKLITMNMFYYGILSAEQKDSGKESILINQEEEIKDLIEQVRRMKDRLAEIEDVRTKSFHKGGHAAEFLKETYKRVKHGRGDYMTQLPPDILPRIAYQMKNLWKEAGLNGPYDFEVMIIRGAVRNDTSLYAVRYAGNYIGDPGKVTVVENVGSVTDREEDCISIALIQPITNEIREANKNAYRDRKNEIMEAVNKVKFWTYILPNKAVPTVKDALLQKSLKPLLILYCTDFEYGAKSCDIDFWGYNYEMSSEAWANAGGPCVPKCYWVSQTYQPPVLSCYRRDMQIYFQ